MTEEMNVQQWVANIAQLIENNENLNPQDYTHFLQDAQLSLELVDLLSAMNEDEVETKQAYYSACVFALEVCVAQLQAAMDSGNKLAIKTLQQLMAQMTLAIEKRSHSLSFWLPILNAFYEVHVELSEDLKNAYFDLANDDDLPEEGEDLSHLQAIRDLIEELSDLSIYDVAENFFAQSYAMPSDFFSDLVIDLYSIEEGQDIALLTLLHPKKDVREVVIATIEMIIDKVILSSQSLTRLQAIKNWYPKSQHPQFDCWIKIQRKKGVVFQKETTNRTKVRIKASEVDGSGAQGLFVHLQKKRSHHLCGLLFKLEVGIKDAWYTPAIPAADVERYYDESFEDSVMLRMVDLPYLLLMVNHFLALSIANGAMPDLHLLEIQESLGVQFVPELLDVDYCLQQLTIKISPFTHARIQEALKKTKMWVKKKKFTESWFLENSHIDRVVNQCCSFSDGVKVCDFEKAALAVFSEIFEANRARWRFHFLWVALWLKAKARKNETVWQDCLLIAHVIDTGMPLKDIPIMQEITKQTVLNSIETMQERRTYLTQQ